MTTPPGKSTITDPASYSNKDLLLLTQLLHTQGLIDPEAVVQSEHLGQIGKDWFTHKSTQLSRRLGELEITKAPSAQQVATLYENLLEENEHCLNTTALANSYYFARIQELEQRISLDKDKFKELLGE